MITPIEQVSVDSETTELTNIAINMDGRGRTNEQCFYWIFKNFTEKIENIPPYSPSEMIKKTKTLTLKSVGKFLAEKESLTTKMDLTDDIIPQVGTVPSQ